MDDDERVLVLPEQPRGVNPMVAGVDRRRALRALAEAQVKVRHDSGGRVLIVDADEEALKVLRETLPDVELLPLDVAATERVEKLDPQDALFVEALRVRLSSKYQEIKRGLKPGETPEEQLLFTASCTPPEG